MATQKSTSKPLAERAPDWPKLRGVFPLLSNFAYLDLGRKAPLPIYAKQAADAWFQDTFDTGGETAFSMSSMEDTRAAVAKTFGAPPDQIALIKNTSEGINIIGAGFPWVSGDNVVITEHEHENNTFPWRHLADRGVEIRFAEADDDGCVRLAGYERVVDDRTRILAVAWVAYGNGYRADIPALSTFCKSRQIKLVVDAIQAVGILPDRVDSLGADVVVAGGHKAQFSLTGAGFMYLTPEMIDMIRPPYAAKYSFTSTDRHQAEPKLQSNARRFEYGNPNFMGLAVQRRSAEFVADIGLENIEARVRELTTYLIDQARARQIRILTPTRWKERAGIVAIAVNGDADEIEAKLKTQGVRIAAKDGHLRAGVHFYNNHEDIDRLIAGLAAA